MIEAAPGSTTDGARHASLPLQGIRAIEFGYGVAAPVCCRNLAQFGADVIKVESVRRPDSLRQVGAGWVPLDTDWGVIRDTGSLFQFTSAGKRSIGLEIDEEPGRGILHRLVAASDVLVMNMSIEAVEHLGLGYERMPRAQRPVGLDQHAVVRIGRRALPVVPDVGPQHRGHGRAVPPHRLAGSRPGRDERQPARLSVGAVGDDRSGERADPARCHRPGLPDRPVPIPGGPVVHRPDGHAGGARWERPRERGQPARRLRPARPLPGPGCRQVGRHLGARRGHVGRAVRARAPGRARPGCPLRHARRPARAPGRARHRPGQRGPNG